MEIGVRVGVGWENVPNLKSGQLVNEFRSNSRTDRFV